jgi:hypothetical protein
MKRATGPHPAPWPDTRRPGSWRARVARSGDRLGSRGQALLGQVLDHPKDGSQEVRAGRVPRSDPAGVRRLSDPGGRRSARVGARGRFVRCPQPPSTRFGSGVVAHSRSAFSDAGRNGCGTVDGRDAGQDDERRRCGRRSAPTGTRSTPPCRRVPGGSGAAWPRWPCIRRRVRLCIYRDDGRAQYVDLTKTDTRSGSASLSLIGRGDFRDRETRGPGSARGRPARRGR